ncbi:MAG: L-rhamnose mutarotase [Verrucomicrobiae bacterium]
MNNPKRHGWVIGLRPENIEEYKRLHAAVWPGVLEMIKACHISNYSIFLRRLDDGQPYLFSYLEYSGGDFAADMAKMAADPTTKRWWEVCTPCQKPLDSRDAGEWWSTMEEVFHLD